jgi:hypothetical protein
MAGVAGPQLRVDVRAGTRFLIGLAVGGAIAGLLLALPVFLLGQAVGQVASEQVRLGIVATLAFIFGILDLAGRTPHVWRQVPQRLWHVLAPGRLGLVWGADLGLLVTTQKTTSLLWLSIPAVALLRPGFVPATLVTLSLIATLVVAAASFRVWQSAAKGGMGWPSIQRARKISGLTMLIAGLATTLSLAIS